MTPGVRREPTCDDCFFRRAGLCALPGDSPCPTFRPADGRHARRLDRSRRAERRPASLRSQAAA